MQLLHDKLDLLLPSFSSSLLHLILTPISIYIDAYHEIYSCCCFEQCNLFKDKISTVIYSFWFVLVSWYIALLDLILCSPGWS